MADNKKQHWIPDSYLRAWCDPIRPVTYEPFVHVFDKNGSGHRRRSPSNIFHAPDLYTVFSSRERDLSIEHLFGRFEQDFVEVRKLLEAGETPDPSGTAALYAFVAAMMVRAPHTIGHATTQFANVVAKARRIGIDPSVPPIKPLNAGRSMTLDEFQRLADDPMGTWFPERFNAQLDVLGGMFGCDVLVNESPYPFLTSDSPAVTVFPPREKQDRRLFPRGLGWPGCTVAMPLSPRLALRFSHGEPGIHRWYGLGWWPVFEVNVATIASAHKKIVSCEEDLFFVQAYLDAARAEPNQTGRTNDEI